MRKFIHNFKSWWQVLSRWLSGKSCLLFKLSIILLLLLFPLFTFISQYSAYITELQAATIRAERYHPPSASKHMPSFDKIIHQIWNNNSSIPDKWKESSASCKKAGEGYTYYLWTRHQLRELIRKEYVWLYQTYMSYQYDIQRVDVAKYVLLYHYGGIYTDLDIVCKYPWNDLLANYTHYGVIMAESTPVGVATDTLVAKKNHPFFKFALDELSAANKWRVVPYATIIFGTGPMFLSTCLMNFENQEQVYVIPNKVYTEEWFGNLHGGSWHEWDGVLIYWVYTHRCMAAVFFISLLVLVYLVLKSCQNSQYTGSQDDCVASNGHKILV